MSCLLGIDLGTSSVKVVAFGVEGALKGIGFAEYPILTRVSDTQSRTPNNGGDQRSLRFAKRWRRRGIQKFWASASPAKCIPRRWQLDLLAALVVIAAPEIVTFLQ
jgi:sugar (pentulose or hexulose) kinase